jgi:FkbM family methyltransferase
VAGKRPGVPARIAEKVRLAASLALFYGSQIMSGDTRRRLLARAHALDPTGGLPLLDLTRRGDVGELVREVQALAREISEDEHTPLSSNLLEDVLHAMLIARADPARHPRAQLAKRFAAHLLAASPGASRSQIAQDLFVTFVLGERRDAGYFVEFGAGDGLELSNTYHLERNLGWTGILAEPNPAHLDALRKNRRSAVSDKCVWSRTGERLRFAVVDEDPALSTLDSFRGGDRHDRTGSRSIEVVTTSLVDLLREHGAPHRIDYVSIDTEGSELAILEAFDFRAFDIATFTVEHNHQGNGRAGIRRLMSEHGYVRLLEEFSRWDDWYVRADVARRLTAVGGPA